MKKNNLLLGILKTVLVLFVLTIVLVCIKQCHQSAYVKYWFFKRNLERINLAVVLYAETHDGVMPIASSWADLIKDKNPLLMKEDFVTPGSYPEVGIYYNNALENKTRSSLKEDTVILFTAEGKWNSNGNIQYFREHSNHRHVYVITLNGEIYRYNPGNKSYLKLSDSQEINSGSLYWE